MKILLAGKDGQVGWELSRSLLPVGEVIALGRDQFDLSRPEELRGPIRRIKPDFIVNAAAYTAVDRAEKEADLAGIINGVAPGVMAEEAKTIDALFVHYSTDYVFDGEKEAPYKENDVPNPLNVYGRSKLDGERIIEASGCNFLILRTAWVYASRGKNFGRTILRLAEERESLDVIADQYGTPTSADLIADITALIIHQLKQDQDRKSKLNGVYHLTASGSTTWYDYARFILETAQLNQGSFTLKPHALRPVPAVEYLSTTKRPGNSTLDTGKLADAFGLSIPDWKVQVRRMVEESLT